MKYGWVGVIAMIALFLLIACVLSFLLKELIAKQHAITTL